MCIKRFTWLAGNADPLPQLIPDQILKLKQLTVLTLAETHKVPIDNTKLLVILFCSFCLTCLSRVVN